MATFSPNFTIGQSGINPAAVVCEDTSSGTDILIVSRRITFQDSNGNFLVVSGTTTQYNLWPLITNPITLNILSQDTAVLAIVEWLDASDVALYTLSQTFCLVEFNKQFLYYLVQQQALQPSIVQDSNYDSNVAVFYTTIVGAINAIEIANDLSASQNCLNRGTLMRERQKFYF